MTIQQPDTTTQPAQPFAHPMEEIFSRILNYYGIEWVYEPTTFVLERDEQGSVTEAFSPDFYLPGQNLYVELTTRRPKLNTLKNRKLRRMQALYPDVNVKLFKRKDLRSLMVKFGLVDEAEKIWGSGPGKDEDA